MRAENQRSPSVTALLTTASSATTSASHDRAEQQGGDGAGTGVEGNEDEKGGQIAAVRTGKAEDTAQGARGELVVTDGGVFHQRAHRATTAASPTRKSGDL